MKIATGTTTLEQTFRDGGPVWGALHAARRWNLPFITVGDTQGFISHFRDSRLFRRHGLRACWVSGHIKPHWFMRPNHIASEECFDFTAKRNACRTSPHALWHIQFNRQLCLRRSQRECCNRGSESGNSYLGRSLVENKIKYLNTE